MVHNSFESYYEEVMKTFPERLSCLINEKGIKQYQLAEELEITAPQVSRLKSGQSSPSLKNLIKIAYIFDVSFDFLLSKRNFPENKKYIDAVNIMFDSRKQLKNEDWEIPDEQAERIFSAVKKAVANIIREQEESKDL